jgi:RNA recognition motif-containing protein
MNFLVELVFFLFFDLEGQVKSAQLNFDANGKSKGSGTVVFAKKQDALKAVQEYNNRTLDNRPMKLELIVDASLLSSRYLYDIHG